MNASAGWQPCPICGHRVDEHDGFCGRSLNATPEGCRVCAARWDSLSVLDLVGVNLTPAHADALVETLDFVGEGSDSLGFFRK